MSTSSAFSFAAVRSSFAKDDFLAFRSAWKALSAKRTPLSAAHYAAHAIVSGKDLYKAFSPSKRLHDQGEPYKALLAALQTLASIDSPYSQFKVKFASLTEEQNAALALGLAAANRAVKDFGITGFTQQKSVVTGAARVDQALKAA
jgi:hypothetical protein